MIIHHDEKDKMQCCSMPKMCNTNECMAWVWAYRIEEVKGLHRHVVAPPPTKKVKTDYGGCGLINKKYFILDT